MTKTRVKKRRENRYEPRTLIRIYCEGTKGNNKTEKLYFSNFNSFTERVTVEALTAGHTDALGIVNDAICALALDSKIDIENGDSVWCVFDRNGNDDNALNEAYNLAEKNGIKMCFSNPCFEFWFLVHYSYYNNTLNDCKFTIEKLEDKLDNYKKNSDCFCQISNKLNDAIARARKIENFHQKNNNKIISRGSNPSTQVYKLVEEIRRMVIKTEHRDIVEEIIKSFE